MKLRWVAAALLALVLSRADAAELYDCTSVAIEGLRRVGVKLKTVPSVSVNRYHAFSGWYRAGRVDVWDNGDCVVLTHEFYHHYQAQRWVIPAFGSLQWMQFERDARVVTERVFEENPDLPKRIAS
jgi:hypothetical protein